MDVIQKHFVSIFKSIKFHASFFFTGDLYNEAAEAAMASMKGRLANKYFALAEECYAEIEEEEEESEQ